MPYVCRKKTVHFCGEETGVCQDFQIIHKKCSEANELFEDDQFPAENCSLFFSQTPGKTFKWKRPRQIKSNPKFADGPSRFDIKQGELRDCWILAGMANLTTDENLFDFVVPKGQSFDDGYAGVFHFRFWRQGKWIDVVIDDRLPTYKKKLAFVSSTVGNEFWSALLEKAYAKMFGSYEAINGGETIESMIDLSGGVPEVYLLKYPEKTKDLFDILHKAHHQKAWLTCSIEGNEISRSAEDMKLLYGLVPGHAYTITEIRKAKFYNEEDKVNLVRIRNPWGNEMEWKGAYKDNAREWRRISHEDMKTMNLEFKYDGEYWMQFEDFMKHFSSVEICHLSQDIFSDVVSEFGRSYVVSVHHNSWSIANGTAGGNVKNKGSFAKNPQYQVTLKDIDICLNEDGKVEDKPGNKCTLIISLMQKNRRRDKMPLLTIGFYVYRIPDAEKWPINKFSNFFLLSHDPIYKSNFEGIYREVSVRRILEPGSYLIVPSTTEPNDEVEFMIRILTEKPPVNCGPIE